MPATTGSQTDLTEKLFRSGAALLGFVGFLSGFAVFGYQLLLWLKDGVWTPIALAEAFQWFTGRLPSPAFGWLGVQKIAELALASSLAGSAAVAGFVALLSSTTNLFQYCMAAFIVATLCAAFFA